MTWQLNNSYSVSSMSVCGNLELTFPNKTRRLPTCNWTCPGGFPAGRSRRDHWCWWLVTGLCDHRSPLVPSLHIWPQATYWDINLSISDNTQLTPELSGDRADWRGRGRVLRTWLRSGCTIRTGAPSLLTPRAEKSTFYASFFATRLHYV